MSHTNSSSVSINSNPSHTTKKKNNSNNNNEKFIQPPLVPGFENAQTIEWKTVSNTQKHTHTRTHNNNKKEIIRQ